jgi:hypothetical protein
MKISRRSFALTVASAAPYILRGQPAALQARILTTC